MKEEKNVINNISPITANANLNITADATDSLNKVTDSVLEVVKPSAKKGSEIVTGLLSFVSETIDTGLYIYKENLNYYKEKCHAKIKAKIDEISQENLAVPDIGILGATMESLKYNLDKDYLVELYSSIIARNVDVNTKDKVHPTYISIIKDLSFKDLCFLEALFKFQNKGNAFIPVIILSIVSDKKEMDKNFKTPKYYINLPDYIVDKDDIGIILENLVRLNLIEIDFQKWLTDDEVYNNIKGQAEIKYKPTFKDLEYVYKCECHVEIREKGVLNLTNLGENLLKLCIK